MTTPPDPHADVPMEIVEVREFREAARIIAKNPTLTVYGKCQGFMRLAEIARKRAVSPELAQGAVHAEFALWSYGPPPSESPDPVERAMRGLSREGYISCPSCRRTLPGEETYQRWQKLRQEAVEWYRLREQAVK